MTDNAPQMSGIFGFYIQVADLSRSLSFYRDVLSLTAEWNDGTLAVLRGPAELAGTLVIREISRDNRPSLGESGVTRVIWQVSQPADLDSAEELLTQMEIGYQRHRDASADSITLRDPDGLENVLLWTGADIRAEAPPAWLYWYH